MGDSLRATFQYSYRTPSDFKTPRSLLKILGFASQFQLFLVFGNHRKSSCSYFNYYVKYLEKEGCWKNQRSHILSLTVTCNIALANANFRVESTLTSEQLMLAFIIKASVIDV